MALADSPHHHQLVRHDLQARTGRPIASLRYDAGSTVRFYGSRRGPSYRVAWFGNPQEARRIAEVLRIARERLGRSVPRVHLDWVDNSVVVTEFVRGRVVDRIGPHRLERCVRLLARLHNVDISRARRLGPMRSCFSERLDDLVDSSRQVPADERPSGYGEWMDAYGRLRRRTWLRVLMHGDTHEGNFVWTPDGAPALIDWDMSMPGPPHFDLAYLLYWRADALRQQGRANAWRRAVVSCLGTYNRSARGRRLELRDLLEWMGCVGLIYLGHGVNVETTYYNHLTDWVWQALKGSFPEV